MCSLLRHGAQHLEPLGSVELGRVGVAFHRRSRGRRADVDSPKAGGSFAAPLCLGSFQGPVCVWSCGDIGKDGNIYKRKIF